MGEVIGANTRKPTITNRVTGKRDQRINWSLGAQNSSRPTADAWLSVSNSTGMLSVGSMFFGVEEDAVP
ncbi:hypothetical protein Tco_0725792 [Tanacetum coccineum]|uniref:Uncharacterized protein n=1 Tax=Tanacetum coccineum TaxID=301880 RepID=A0ABQ4YES0_9ASTR